MKQFILIVFSFCIVSALSALLMGNGTILTFLDSAEALDINILLAVCAAVCSFFFGVATGDYSWVVRLWSILPVVFAWIYALKSGGSWFMYALVCIITLWGARLTFNFARKGG